MAEKVALCAIVGCALGLLLALGFGIAAEISSSGAAWARIPLLLVPLTAAGAAFGALGCVVGAAARDLRAASLVGVALVTPIVLVGLVPRQVSPLAAGVSELLPFAPAVARVRRGAVRRRAALDGARGERAPAAADGAPRGRVGRRSSVASRDRDQRRPGAPGARGSTVASGSSAATRAATSPASLGAHPEQSVLGPAPESVQPNAPSDGRVLLDAAEHRRERRAVGLVQAVVERARECLEVALASASTSSAVRCRL